MVVMRAPVLLTQCVCVCVCEGHWLMFIFLIRYQTAENGVLILDASICLASTSYPPNYTKILKFAVVEGFTILK